MVALVVSAPLLALAALAVKATSPGPVMFRQERVGWRGRRFRIYKLRSMYVDGDERLRAAGAALAGGPVVKLRRDPRVTAVGHVLRKLSLDELPQLLNVVRGEMSLVGPRPEQPCEVVLWTPAQFDRLRVRPGLTGVWQVSGRSDARDAKDRLDLYYVDNWSMWRDVSILARTVPVVLSSKGAY
jgi:lipopolysaccharide/colanic/teichoic acid biosynthesis glycosyltransferase